MTYKELCDEICALGFETELDDGDRVLCAVRRAVMTVYTEIPMYGRLVFYKSANLPKEKIPDFCHVSGKEETIPFLARAYSFRTCGTGGYKIREGSSETSFNFSGTCELHRGFLHGAGEIEFFGDYSYTVFDIALYDEIYADTPESIPDGDPITEIDLSVLREDFLMPASELLYTDGGTVKGASIVGSRVRMPSELSGKFVIHYKKAPPVIERNPDGLIALPDGCTHLCALLAASYVWLDDDSEKAYYYMNLYKDALASVKRTSRHGFDSSYKDVTGWA